MAPDRSRSLELQSPQERFARKLDQLIDKAELQHIIWMFNQILYLSSSEWLNDPGTFQQ